MRIHPTAVVGSALLVGLIGTLPAASQSVQPIRPTTSLAAAADWKAKRDAYVQKARDEVQEWQRQLHDLREKRRAKNSKADITTRNDFKAAWIETEDAFHKLETVSAEDWESARKSYDKAALKLAAIWEKIKT